MENVKNWLEEWIYDDSNQANVKEKAVIYYRKRKNRNNIDVLVNYCSDKNLKVIETYNVNSCYKKGSLKHLCDLLHLLSKQKDKIHVVCNDFYDIFQDDGDLQIFETLINREMITIHILKQNFIIDKNSYNPEMKVYFNLMLLKKCCYISTLSHNIRVAQQHYINKGFCMHLAPIGYKNVRYTSGRPDVVVDTIKAPIITKLFKEYSTGSYSIKTLTELAHTLGLKNRKGKPVSETCINDMLKNRFYIGMQRWNETLYPHKYPTIIDESLFDKVQEVLMEHTC